MSIYNGKCDRGSMTSTPCPNAAEFYSNEMAWCREDGAGRTPKGDREWTEIVAEWEADRLRKIYLICLAEESRAFLYYESELLTPREVRQMLKNGHTLSGLSIEERPLAWAESLEREAEDEIEEARSKRRDAKRIRRQYQRIYGTEPTI